MGGLATYGIRFIVIVSFYAVATVLLSTLAPTLPNELVQAIVTIILTFNDFALFVPIDTVYTIIKIAIPTYAAFYLWSVLDWLLRRTRS